MRLSPAQTKPVFARKDGRLFRGGEARSPLRRDAARFLATDVVFLGILVIGAVAFVFDLLMRRIEGALVPWKGKA